MDAINDSAYYTNKNLFSRHYLDNRLRRSTIWEVEEEELRDAFNELKQIYEREEDYLPERKNDEVELRNDFITPILRKVLGFKKEQEKASAVSARVPDYALYPSTEKKKEAVQSKDYYKHAIGLLEAKAWKANLERKTASGGQDTENNPTKQIVDYLIENKPQWGILTNGKRWRLVHREASNRLDTYYEVDIETIIEEDDLEAFKYFYVFFRRAAFEGHEGEKILDNLREESLQYATDIGEDLEENIYQALEWIAKGYLQNSSNDGIEDEPIERIHDKSLILLYRLLFALYADARGILGNPSGRYSKYNFSDMVDEVCETIDEGDGYGKTGLLGNRLWEIFSLIDQGSKAKDIPEEELRIPAYNGGLFAPDEFFKEYNLHDEYLAKVIDLVARTDHGEQSGRAQVDYFDLSVRHLGGIYEGLLEYELKRKDHDVVEVQKSGDTVIMPLEEAKEKNKRFDEEDIIPAGEPFNITDNGKRKATGSYYTPDYIVKYIVENTVGPVVEEKIENHETDEEIAAALLDTKILDPAMGSGHFLVEVIDYIASRLVDYQEVDIQKAKRRVAKQCVYGVDVNPLATELGKLSIWLTTIAEDKPLSFLDHHIKSGNSLIGADIHNLNHHPEEQPEEDEDKAASSQDGGERQATLGEEFGDGDASVIRANVTEMLEMFREIEQQREDSPEDIKKQEEVYEKFLNFSFRKRFDVLADVYISYYFNNEFSVDDYNRLLQAFKKEERDNEDSEEWENIIHESWVQNATNSLSESPEDNLSQKKQFFHWKLEFPEVFFSIEKGNERSEPGFDAVIGNPPWARVKKVVKASEDYRTDLDAYNDLYGHIQKGELNTYQLFIYAGNELVKSDGRFGYIVPNSFLLDNNSEPIRHKLLKDYGLFQLIEFSEDATSKIFPDITQATTITLAGVEREEIQVTSLDELPKLSDIEFSEISRDFYLEFPKNLLVTLQPAELNLLQDILVDDRIGDFWEVNDGELHMTKFKDAFTDDDTHEPLITGSDIDRFFISEHPKKGYVVKEKLPDRFRDLAQKKRVLLQRIANQSLSYRVVGAPAEPPTFAANSTISILPDKKEDLWYLSAILNSSLLNWTFRCLSSDNNVPAWKISFLPVTFGREERLREISKEINNLRKEIEEESRSFLKWIERQWKVNIENLSLKTNLKEYWKHDFSEMIRIAEKNQEDIDANIDSREFLELLEEEWTASKSKIANKEEKIEDYADELDSIIFRLFGVSKDEADIVLNDLGLEEKNELLDSLDRGF
ncbi:MAG: Eco57I restriction-modification methylase domain-containing protein [Candidatus Aenigmatarchaeota archaeon]